VGTPSKVLERGNIGAFTGGGKGLCSQTFPLTVFHVKRWIRVRTEVRARGTGTGASAGGRARGTGWWSFAPERLLRVARPAPVGRAVGATWPGPGWAENERRMQAGWRRRSLFALGLYADRTAAHWDDALFHPETGCSMLEARRSRQARSDGHLRPRGPSPVCADFRAPGRLVRPTVGAKVSLPRRLTAACPRVVRLRSRLRAFTNS
jgi:hypothetical protein